VTQLDGVMYVVTAESAAVKMYKIDSLSPLRDLIYVRGLQYPSDIVVSRDERQLYVADFDWRESNKSCIWQVSVDDHKYVKWLPTESTADKFRANTLSMTSQGLLVTSSRDPVSLREYSTTDKQLLRDISLPGHVKMLYHGIETTRGTFVICHQGTARNEDQYAVSEMFSSRLQIESREFSRT